MDDLWGEEPDWFQKDDADEDGEDTEDGGPASKAQHTIVLVDCSKESFDLKLPDPEFPEEQISSVDWCIAALLRILRFKTRAVTIEKTGKRDGFSVILFNTKEREPIEPTDSPEEEKDDKPDPIEDEDNESMSEGMSVSALAQNVHFLLPLEPPGVAAIKKLQSTKQDPSADCELDLEKEYCPSTTDETDDFPEATSLQKAIEKATEAFTEASCVKQRPSKKDVPDGKQIWILTSNPDPLSQFPSDNPEHKNIITEKISDIRGHGIEILVWPVGKDPSSFDDSFYTSLDMENRRDVEDEGDGLDDLVESMESQFKTIRRAYSVPLLLPNWKALNVTKESPHIMLDFFKLVQPSTFPTKVQIHQETGKRLARITQQVMQHGGEVLWENRSFDPKKSDTAGKDRVRSVVEFYGQKIILTAEDVLTMKRLGNANQVFASLLLLGFKKTEDVPFFHAVEHSYFAYPNDTVCVGSVTAFENLHASMVKKGVVGVGELLTRSTAIARLVVLRAQGEEVDEDGTQIRQPGLIVTALPYEDEMKILGKDRAAKHLEEHGTDIAPKELVEAAAALIEKQTFKGAEIGENFENAQIGRFWNFVENAALDESQSKKTFDTEIDTGKVSERLADEIDSFLQAMPEEPEPEKTTRKSPMKRKIEDDSGIDWEETYNDGSVGKCKVPDLKLLLKSIGAPVGGKKADLLERVMEHLDRKYGSKVDTGSVKQED